MSERFEFVNNIFCGWSHWLRSPFHLKLIVYVGTRTRYISLISTKSLFCRFKLRSSCGIDFNNNAVTVWDSFYIGFDNVTGNIILSRTSFVNRFLIKKCFSHSCWIEWSWKWWCFNLIFLKILSRTNRTRQFWYFIQLPLSLKDKSHY